jgi:hypothetical protein
MPVQTDKLTNIDLNEYLLAGPCLLTRFWNGLVPRRLNCSGFTILYAIAREAMKKWFRWNEDR